MDLETKIYVTHRSEALSPIKSQESSISQPPLHSSDPSFPIIAIAIIGILATAFLLVSYYIFVINCCLSWHRIDPLIRFSLSGRRRRHEGLMIYSPPMLQPRGLDESVIQSIPIFQFKKRGNSRDFEERRRSSECAVCLNEFQEDEKLRIVPNCSHLFHIDCIDVWLQSHTTCPLCRTTISCTTHFPIDQITAPSTSPQDLNHPNPYIDTGIGGDEDFVVIELGFGNNSTEQSLLGRQERSNSGELSAHSVTPSPRKLEQRSVPKKARKFHKISSMGDECIDVRCKDDQFSIQPIRRSFSMDSSADRQLYLAVQEIVQQQRQGSEVSPVEGCSSRVKRSFFSFGNGRGSRSAVLPVYMKP